MPTTWHAASLPNHCNGCICWEKGYHLVSIGPWVTLMFILGPSNLVPKKLAVMIEENDELVLLKTQDLSPGPSEKK